MIRREHFRGVVWPHGTKDGKFVYAVVGIVVTDKPVTVGHTHSDAYIDGSTDGSLLDTLATLDEYNAPSRFGDANATLLALGRCNPAKDGKCGTR